jgi:hypothetical protein
MGFEIVEVDGAPTKDGRLPVKTELSAGGIILKVSSVFNTHHYVDSTLVEHTCDDTTETLYKTYTNLAEHYLRELIVCAERKETILYIYIDDVLYSEIDMDEIYDATKNNDYDSFATYFGVYKNKKNLYTVRLLYDNTPVVTDLKLKVKYGKSGSKNIKMDHVIITYNEEVS